MCADTAQHPFQFVTQYDLIGLTGLKARDLEELLKHLKTVPGSVIYYHTHHFLRQHQYLSPEPTNDFAYWVTQVLQEGKLGEQLAAIDTVRFPSIRSLAEKIIQVIEAYVSQHRSLRVAPEGEEFHFQRVQSFFMPTPYRAANLEDLLQAIKQVSIQSLYYHIFAARIRLGKETNDFSYWLESELGEKDLARAIARLDPYTRTLENLRQTIANFIANRLKKGSPKVEAYVS